MKKQYSLPVLAETAVMIALAVVLSLITLFTMPQGGKVSAGSMVPLLLVAMRRGPAWGVAAGVIYGLIDFAMKPAYYHPIQFLLDYPVAFGALGLAGLVRSQSAWVGPLMGSLAIGGRFVAHLVSGAIFFAEYAPAGQNPWVYSAIYNATYLVPELLISFVVLLILLPKLRAAFPTGVGAGRRSV